MGFLEVLKPMRRSTTLSAFVACSTLSLVALSGGCKDATSFIVLDPPPPDPLSIPTGMPVDDDPPAESPDSDAPATLSLDAPQNLRPGQAVVFGITTDSAPYEIIIFQEGASGYIAIPANPVLEVTPDFLTSVIAQFTVTPLDTGSLKFFVGATGPSRQVRNYVQWSPSIDDEGPVSCPADAQCGDQACGVDPVCGQPCGAECDEGFVCTPLGACEAGQEVPQGGLDPICGDGEINQADEVCDGVYEGPLSCADYGFMFGELACKTDCSGIDETACTNEPPASVCGDGDLAANESCEDGNFAEKTCETLGYDSGELACSSNCEIDTSACLGERSCPEGMTLIPGGSYTDALGPQEVHDVRVFCLDTSEVTVSAYQECIDAGSCETPVAEFTFEAVGDYNYGAEGRETYPMNGVNRAEATTFCSWAGKQLAGDWQWEWAARGRLEARTYPWGESDPDCTNTVLWAPPEDEGCGTGITAEAGSRAPSGNSLDSVLDMAGNVAEWTDGVATDSLTDTAVTRGGSYRNFDLVFFRAANRSATPPGARNPVIGFRCAAPATAP